MIYTVTFNPAIDCVMQVENLAFGHVNRALTQEFYFGGKGVNVSYVLSHLGRTNITTNSDQLLVAEYLTWGNTNVGRMTCNFLSC